MATLPDINRIELRAKQALVDMVLTDREKFRAQAELALLQFNRRDRKLIKQLETGTTNAYPVLIMWKQELSPLRKNLEAKIHLHKAIEQGVQSRIRPVVMTALMAAIGLLPAAMSTGIGSETQKPLAIVVIGGLITSTILTLLILPVIYSIAYNLIHKRENRKLLRKMGVISHQGKIDTNK